MLIRIFAIAVLCVCCSNGQAEDKAVEIPLSEIWALDMPGTRDVYGLEFGEKAPRMNVGWGPVEYNQSRVTAINRMIEAISKKLPSEEAPRAFIFSGEPSVPALARISEMLYGVKKFQMLEFDHKKYPRGGQMTLVFFSYPSNYYVHIKEVAKIDHLITVKYQLVPHFTAESTMHFALIPLQELSTGEYQVRFEQLRMDKSFIKTGFIPMSNSQEKRFVCNNFQFQVWEPVEPDTTEASAEALDIPLKEIWGYSMPGTKDISELDSENEDPMQSVSSRIRRANSQMKMWEKAGKGFAVSGTPQEALAEAERVFTAKKQRTSVFTPEDEISLFVFTRGGGGSALLERIVRDGRQIRVEYHIGSRSEGGVPLHLALVPLGKLDKGRYSVEMIMRRPQPGPIGAPKPISQDFLDTYISQNFSFSVQ
jgi:hypothetical protein